MNPFQESLIDTHRAELDAEIRRSALTSPTGEFNELEAIGELSVARASNRRAPGADFIREAAGVCLRALQRIARGASGLALRHHPQPDPTVR